MSPNKNIRRSPRLAAAAFALVTTAPAHADIQLGIQTGLGSFKDICLVGLTVYVTVTGDECGDGRIDPTEFRVNGTSGDVVFDATTGAASFSAPVTISNTNFQASGLQAFSGTSTFNSTVSFVGPSVTFGTGTTFSNLATFNGLADFNNGITANSISSTTISSTSLTSGLVHSTRLEVEDDIYVSPGANITMGNNIVHGVAAGVVDTDAVNVAQLNAATSGITADVTALETDVTALEAT